MLSVLGVSAAAVYAKRYAGQYSVLAVTGVQLAVGGVALTLLALAAEELPAGPSTTGVLGLFYAGSVGTFVPLALYYMLIRYVTVTYSTIIGYIIPFVAVVHRGRSAGRAAAAGDRDRGACWCCWEWW